MAAADIIRAVAGNFHTPLAVPLGTACDRWWPSYEITTLDRQAMFLAQIAHETDRFLVLGEYASGAAYEGRKDLGNAQLGDGVRYKGRGGIMLTGRDNYRQCGADLDLPLEDEPDRVAEPDVAVQVSCWFWRRHNLNALADIRDFLTMTKRINGGTNGWDDRFKYWGRAWLALSKGA